MLAYYNIVCIADEAYAQHTAVMLASLFSQNVEKQFRVFLMTYTMSEETKREASAGGEWTWRIAYLRG